MRAAAGTGPFFLRKRTFTGDTGPPRKALRSRGNFANDDEPSGAADQLTRDLVRRLCDALALGGGPDPQHNGSAFGHERQAPLRRHDRRRERFRERDAVTVCCLLFRPALDHARVGRRPPPQELALATVCFQQRELALWERVGERDSRYAAART